MNLRLVSARVLLRVVQHRVSLTVALEDGLQSINNKDGAFIQAVCYGVMRHYQRLDYLLGQLVDKPLRSQDSDIKMLLMVGLFQLDYMRVKPYAAVSETVLAAGKKGWAKPLINGTLRRFIRERDALNSKADQHPAARYSHPPWLIAKITRDWPEHATNILQQNNQQAPMALRVNLAKNSRDFYLNLLQQQSIAASIHPSSDSAIVLAQPVAVEKLPGFSAGLVSVQDTAAQLAAPLLAVRGQQSVLDLCAAPGGKTGAILELAPPSLALLAVDIDADRLSKVSTNLRRLELQATLVAGDATALDSWLEERLFERILIDAPCSATGVIRRHPDIKILRRESDLDALQSTQQQLLNAAWKRLRPKGILVYATCSILKQENENQINTFLASHTDASELIIDADWGIKTRFGRQVLTGDLAMDGFYYAKLLKA